MNEARVNALVPPVLDMTVNRHAAFKSWKKKWTDYVLLTKLKDQANDYQAAMIRYTFSAETNSIYESFKLTAAENDDPDIIITKLEEFAKGIVNETLERHMFHSRNQQDGEPFDEFLTEIKLLAQNCGFCTDDCYAGNIRDRVVGGINSDSLRRKLLSEKDLKLKKAEDICRADEKASQGVQSYKDRDKEELNYVAKSNNTKHWENQGRNQHSNNSYSDRHSNNSYSDSSRNSVKHDHQDKKFPSNIKCKFCMRDHKYGRQFCPAYGKKCDKCGRTNHFPTSKICSRNKNINEIEEEEELNALFLGTVDVESNKSTDSWEIEIPAEKGLVRFKVDTGADVTVVKEEDFELMGLTRSDLRKTNKSLIGPSSSKLKCLGYTTTTFTWGSKSSTQVIYVCQNLRTSLLGKPAISALDIVKLYRVEEMSVNELNDTTKIKFVEEFPVVFKGLGCIKGEPITIELEEDAAPYHITAARHVALPMMEALKTELKRMEKLGVIRKVEEPTEWCHPIVIVKKPTGELRICLDLTKLNSVSKRQYYQLESVDETLAKLGKECVFMTKLDANSGYWQMPLSEESQLKATFITPFGRFCPTRSPFGLNSMPEIFNRKIDEMIEGLEGVAKSTDDFLIYAKTEEQHDERLRKLLKVFAENGVTLNLPKCKFSCKEVEFLGHFISDEGITPLERKVDAIIHYPTPTSIKELRRFMGMAQQLSKFTPKLAEVSAPLRDLLSPRNKYLWTEQHDKAFEETKEVLADYPTLAHYDVTKETKIRTDGSKLNGISAILYQKHDDTWKPVAFASRYLSETEKNYHNIEIEMLAAVWGCEKMAKYIHGLPYFKLQTDHNPLVPILNYKPLAEMSPRIQRLRMRMLRFSFTAEYVKGETLLDADALSRAPTYHPSPEDEIAENEIEYHVDCVIANMPATNCRLTEIKKATKIDKVLQEVIKYTEEGWPRRKQLCREEVKEYWTVQNDLTYLNGLVLKGNRIVIPRTLRRSMLQKIHVGHLGMDKCKRRARQTIYWPGMNNQISLLVGKCETCLEYQSSKNKEPLLPPELPNKPWKKVGTDIFQYANKKYVVIMDYYSLWPEVYELKYANAECVIDALKEAFARHGIPEEVVSDNGTQYTSFEFRKFKRRWEFKHTTSSPHYPRSNGLAESAVKAVKRLIKKAIKSKQDILEGLLVLRNTPLSCGSSPAQLLKGCRLRDNLPSLEVNTESRKHQRDLVKERKTAKLYHDRTAGKTVLQKFNNGELVALQDINTKEWSCRGRIVEEVAPRSYTVEVESGNILRRNQRFIRKVHSITALNQDLSILDDTLPYDETLPYEEEENSTADTEDTATDEVVEEIDASENDASNTNNKQDKTENQRSKRSNVVKTTDQTIEEEGGKSRFGRKVVKKTPVDYDDI